MAEDLSKRGKVGDVYRSGSFTKAKKKGLKVSDLKKSQLKRAQTVGGKKITARQVKRATNVANETNISDTKFVKGQGVLGPNGKPLTGSVTLASGKTAQYVKGRRVVAGAKKAPSGGGGGGGGRTVTKASPYSATKKKTYSNNTVGANVRERTPSKVGPMSAAQANKLGAEGAKGRLKPGPAPKVSPYGRNKARLNPNLAYSRRIEKLLAANKNLRYGR